MPGSRYAWHLPIMGALLFLISFLLYVYHTSEQNIQILGYLDFAIFFRFWDIQVLQNFSDFDGIGYN